MIVGIGTDFTELARIKASYDRFGERFLQKILTPDELKLVPENPIAYISGRFAAKEAFSKAVGTGFKRGVFMKDIGVGNARSGAPTLQLTGGGAARLAAITPEGHGGVVRLTLTYDRPSAQAIV